MHALTDTRERDPFLPTALPNPYLDHAVFHPGIAKERKHALSSLMVLNIFSALSAALLVTPIVTVIDRSIFIHARPDAQHTSLIRIILNGFSAMFARPKAFVRDPAFRWVLALYVGTYSVANAVEELGNQGAYDPALPTFLAASATNVTLNVLKDRYLTRALGSLPCHNISPATYSLYAGRDMLTVFASFTLPPLLVPTLTEKLSLGPKEAALYAQFLAPVGIQTLSAPLHLLGMDIYNRRGASFGQRWKFLCQNYWSTTGFRMARKIPAFGLGGVTNSWLRETGRRAL
ncbi:hypothetical protein DFS34DRAFT_187196 [Phlyctochytrium arcticum]|nr:hypothetical protein DFS34DRAFT_187196 [Phlyctochytrium arcticum]